MPRAERNPSTTGRNVNLVDEPVRALGGPLGERIAAGLTGREAAAFKREA